MDQEIDEDKRANLNGVEAEGSEGPVESSPEVCETSQESAGEVPVPHPDADKASDASGLEKVEIEGKPMETKADVEKSSSDEASTGDSASGIGFLKELLGGEILGVPLWIWGAVVIALLVVLWVLSGNMVQPLEPLE